MIKLSKTYKPTEKNEAKLVAYLLKLSAKK
jgi:hypothetical protein